MATVHGSANRSRSWVRRSAFTARRERSITCAKFSSPRHVSDQQPEVLIGQASDKFDAQGNLTDEATRGFVRDLLRNLVDWTRRLGPAS
jgi:hypothetical protein